MAPKLKEQLSLRSQRGAHRLTFDLKGDYAYVAPNKNSDDGTETFNARRPFYWQIAAQRRTLTEQIPRIFPGS